MKKIALAVLALLALVGLSAPAQAQVDPNLNNSYASNAIHFPEASTVSNQVRFVLARGYGMCVVYGARTDEVFYNNTYTTSVSGFAQVVADDGACTGGQINTTIVIETAPIMPDAKATFNSAARLRGCTGIASGAGYVSTWVFSGGGDCAPAVSTAYGYFKYPQFGVYSQYTVVKVFGAVFGHVPPYHAVLQPPMWGG